MAEALVGLIMGSKSDWDTMQHAAQILDALGVPHETKIVSAHRTPDLLFEYAASAEQRGIEVIIAGAGGAAHLPGMAAATRQNVRPSASDTGRAENPADSSSADICGARP